MGCRKRLKEYRISKIDLCSPCVDIVPKWREIPYLILNNNVCCKNIKNISYLYNFINRKLLEFLIFLQDMENEWTIPIGETTMLPLVTYTTLLLTILCTVFLIHTIWKSMPKQHLKRE